MNKEVKELIEEIEFIRDTFADGVFIELLNKILNYITNTEQKVKQLENQSPIAISTNTLPTKSKGDLW